MSAPSADINTGMTMTRDRLENIKKGKRNRRRGHDFERECVRYFKEKGWSVHRRDQSRGGEYNPDIKFASGQFPMNDHHHECKRVSRFSAFKWWDQALSDAGGREPVILIRADDKEAMVLISRKRYEELCRIVNLHEVF